MRTVFRPVALACAALLAACGGGSNAGSDGTGDSIPAPTVSGQEPATGALVADAPYVKVTFSEAMDPTSVAAGLGVSKDGGGPVAGTVTGAGAVWFFTPSLPFPAASTLRVNLSAEILSARGGRLAAAQSRPFDTAHWRALPLTGAPTARSQHTAVWTGTEVIVWGGTPLTRTGGRYDPVTNSWLPTAVTGAPVGRTGHSAIWSGTEMIVWGGTVAGAPVADGGRYDPVTDTWRTMSAAGAPSARSGHTALWNGSRMIVWGATPDLSGALYDPATDAWTPMTSTGAPLITSDHRVAGTGSRMIVWGGTYQPPSSGGDGAGICCPDYTTNAGGIYDPATNSWTAIPTTGAPTQRKGPALVWTGTELLIWGGMSGGNLLSPCYATGGRLSPATGTWIPTADAGAPTARSQMHAAWTGTRLLVWGGVINGLLTDHEGGLYDPVTDTWTPVANLGGLAALQRGAASVWTGTELIVLGGESGTPGARFTP